MTNLSIRTKLFLLIAGLVVGNALALWLLLQQLTHQLNDEAEEIAYSVSRSVIQILDEGQSANPGEYATVEKHLIIEVDSELTGSDELKPGETLITHREFSIQNGEDDTRMVSLQLSSGAHAGMANHFEIPIPHAGLQHKVEHFSAQILTGLLALLAIGLVLAAIIAYRISNPLKKLVVASERVADGDFGTQVKHAGGDEAARAITAFNQMSRRLKQLDDDTNALRSREHLGELGEIARGLAHSLRNPLNAIGLGVEQMAANQDHDPSIAVTIRGQIRRIDESIRAFLVIADDHTTETTSETAAELVRDVMLEVTQECSHAASITLSAPSDPLTLSAVAPELRAAIQAIVVNAIEASSPEGEIGVILESLPDQRVAVRVVDHGAGVCDSVRKRLFQPHTTTKAHGSGMGLFLARKILETRYDGSIELHDTPGGGTTVTLEFGDRV